MNKDFKTIMDEIKENLWLLDECDNHEFNIEIENQLEPFHKQWRCSNCRGIVEHEMKVWYEKGKEHSVIKNKNDDLPSGK